MIKAFLKSLNWRMAERSGIMLARTANLYPWQAKAEAPRRFDPESLPEGALPYLRSDNPRLLALQERYRSTELLSLEAPIWKEGTLGTENLLYFRGNNPYVWQSGNLNMGEIGYALSYYYSLAHRPDLVELFTEDGAFGSLVYSFDECMVSRDMLDSIQEIDFLQRNVGIGTGSWNILDIGAGYGRLAHRLSQATSDDVAIFATDAYAPSTFISEYYLRYRKAERASAIPLDEVDDLLARQRIDLAVNIHSFSECGLDAIDWWIYRIAHHGVRYLMVIPNQSDGATSHCLTNDGRDMEEVFERRGYRCVRREPRYSDPFIQKYGIDPAQLCLFRLS